MSERCRKVSRAFQRRVAPSSALLAVLALGLGGALALRRTAVFRRGAATEAAAQQRLPERHGGVAAAAKRRRRGEEGRVVAASETASGVIEQRLGGVGLGAWFFLANC